MQDREFAAPRSGVGEKAIPSRERFGKFPVRDQGEDVRTLAPASAVATASPVLSGQQPSASAASTALPACKLRAGQPPGTPWWVWVAPDHASITESRYKEKSPGDDPSETWASHEKGPPPLLAFADWDSFAFAQGCFEGLKGTEEASVGPLLWTTCRYAAEAAGRLPPRRKGMVWDGTWTQCQEEPQAPLALGPTSPHMCRQCGTPLTNIGLNCPGCMHVFCSARCRSTHIPRCVGPNPNPIPPIQNTLRFTLGNTHEIL